MAYEDSTNEQQDSGKRYYAQPRVCQFCTDKSILIDYKSVELLRRYVSDDGKIRPRRQTGACSKHQREIANAIKRARQLAFLPFTGEVPR